MPQPTVLSTVWEGPTGDAGTDTAAADEVQESDRQNADRSRLHRWLFAPATGRRALIITTVAAVAFGGLLIVGGFDQGSQGPPTSAVTENSVDSTQGSLSSRAVASDGSADLAPIVREAVSADGRFRVTAESARAETGPWMLEANLVDDTGQVPIVRFTVNGLVIEDVDRAPYRLVLGPEILASLPVPVEEGQPLIVTASAEWPVDGETSSPATLVLPN